jgi:mannose-6-phosphate isomerase-like protein (cupin superfamily)
VNTTPLVHAPSGLPGDSQGGSAEVPRPPAFYELAGQNLDEAELTAQHSWYIRGQNFCIAYTWASGGGIAAREDLPDEHIIVIPGATRIRVAAQGGGEVSVTGPAVVIVPPGTSSVAVDGAGALLRVFSARAADILARARNGARYDDDPALAPPPDQPPPGPGTVRAYRAADIPDAPARSSLILRTDSLMIEWFPPVQGSSAADALSPHVHADFEQASVALEGDYVHHLRTPWTARLRDWRDDEHVQVTSPSITIIPPGIVHTTRPADAGPHHLVDVFTPPRADLAAVGWVINDSDYPTAVPTPVIGGNR